jgi:hypothetical protein
VIGEGLSASLDAIASEWSSSGQTDAAVVLLSDGLDTEEDSLDPAEVAGRAASLGVPVYAVVMGEPGKPGGPNVELMSQIASTTSGDLSSARTAEELTGAFEQLGTQLSTQLAIGSRAQLFVIVAALLAFAAAGLVLVAAMRSSDYR